MTTRAERMFNELLDTAALSAAIPGMRPDLLTLAGFHQGLAFMRDQPDLARELAAYIEEVYAETATLASEFEVTAQSLNAFLVQAAHGDA
jgi:hypothetical protein